ncbi:VOC family protein [Egibacter rhizosphaerae]|uniref:VOC family protein n=1 Tax=Egibacter rhizosphaerae TaxID=1670831 RepID=UPI003B830B1B
MVLTCADVEATTRWYAEVLGLEPITFAGGRRGLAVGEHKINLHQAGSEYVPHAAAPTPGGADFCLRVAADVERLAEEFAARGVIVELGPVDKVGAQAPLRSIYLRDPDGNLVELANERPPQP